MEGRTSFDSNFQKIQPTVEEEVRRLEWTLTEQWNLRGQLLISSSIRKQRARPEPTGVNTFKTYIHHLGLKFYTLSKQHHQLDTKYSNT